MRWIFFFKSDSFIHLICGHIDWMLFTRYPLFFKWNWKIERKCVEIRQRRWTQACYLMVLYCICLLIYISNKNKTWESVEESVRWDDRRERKNNCEEKVQPRQLSLLLVVWSLNIYNFSSVQVVLFARNTSPKSLFFPCKNVFSNILFFYFPI
jgi:hypothetical protein